MPVILVTNDDGVLAPGISFLAESMRHLGDTYVIAPDRERSASSHSLTIHKPLRVQRLGERMWSVSGTPTDCVAVGALKLLPEKPALIASGINAGPNLGDDVTYSGTVSAAMEGTIMNIPSLAVSLDVQGTHEPRYETAAGVARGLAAHILDHALPYDTLLNVNVPNLPPADVRGMKLTRQGKRVYDGAVRETASPWGEVYYWIGGGTPYWEHGEDTDISAVTGGYVSVTPLHLDLTNHDALRLFMEQGHPWNSRSSGG